METLERKIKELGLKPFDVDDCREAIKDPDFFNDELWDYYKRYGDTVMLYSESYLNDSSLEELIRQDKKNKDTFGLTLKGKINNWIDRLWFRYGW